ncbi:hypothetical protein [Methanoculleus sp. UBA413]|mgnify:FL=1|jgi:hypothetical protein|uniref:hypothetical protein n=1 Tax=Methanoculleus sp. UBA413 TaxID=1915509 RepID=UPI00257E094C|nr:hypothetical protein [Methanoculleus sp. UBA413]
MGGSEGCTHLELAAIFAAFITVATLFSLVSFGAGAIDSGPAAGTGAYPVLAANEPHIALAGEITGSLSVPEPAGTCIDTLTFRIAHTGEGEAIDLSRVTVTVIAGDYLEILARSGDFLPGPGMWTATLPAGGSTLLEPGEECTVRLCLDRPVPAGDDLTIKVRPEGCRPCTISGPVRVLAAGAGASLPEKD